uniref:Putative g-protein coupled receptor n=1 Tax=Schistosoma mansoni TaxID=6183 RepID=A0A3Q0KN47_SCHMA
MSLMTANLSNQIPTVLIMLSIICFIGIFGNILVIIVYSLKQDRLTGTLFILVLAISDLLACVTLIPGTMIIEYIEWNIDSTFLCKFYYFINNTFIPFSSLLISCIAFDRYFCLCHPFKNILTRDRAKHVIFILILICSILGLSSTFTVRVEQIQLDDININNHRHSNITRDYNLTMKLDYSMNSYYKNEKFECTEILKLNHTMIETVLYQIVQKSQTFSYILCILCVVTLYILIYRSVSKVFKKRLELKGIKKQTKNLSEINKTNNNNNGHHNKKKKINKLTLRNPFHIQSKKIQKSPIKFKLSNQENLLSHTEELDQHGYNNNNNNNSNTISSISKYNETTKPLLYVSFNTTEIKNNNEEINEKLNSPPQQQDQQQTITSNPIVTKNFYNLINKSNTESIINQSHSLNHQKNLIINNNEEKLHRSIKTIKENITFQNLKTASMLFVVAIVYIITFIPAMLMAIEYVPLYLPIFYLYYINNAINPIIYGFMNRNFRTDIQLLICQKLKCM